MNRRLFLASLAGFALDPERLLWRPGQRKIFIPKRPAPVITSYVLTWEGSACVQVEVLYGSRWVRAAPAENGKPIVIPKAAPVDWSSIRLNISQIDANAGAVISAWLIEA